MACKIALVRRYLQKELALHISSNKWSYVFVLVAYKTAKYIFLLYIYIEIRTNVLARNACGNDVTRETAKSYAKYTKLHIYVSLIYDFDLNGCPIMLCMHVLGA